MVRRDLDEARADLDWAVADGGEDLGQIEGGRAMLWRLASRCELNGRSGGVGVYDAALW